MQRHESNDCLKPGAEDLPAMRARTMWLEELFFLDGRDRSATLNTGCLLAWLLSIKTWSQLTASDG